MRARLAVQTGEDRRGWRHAFGRTWNSEQEERRIQKQIYIYIYIYIYSALNVCAHVRMSSDAPSMRPFSPRDVAASFCELQPKMPSEVKCRRLKRGAI